MEEAKANGADILVSSEESCGLLYGEEEEYISFVSNLAYTYHLPIIVGADVYLDEMGDFNKNCLYYFDENGVLLDEYIKNTLLPYESNSYLKVKSDPLYEELKLNNGNILKMSCSICYDINNQNLINHSNKNSNLFVNISWSWYEIDTQQQNIQLLRMLENGTSLVTSTYDATPTNYCYNGSKIDEYYRYIDNRRDLKMFDVIVPENRINTFYSNISGFINYIYPLSLAAIIIINLIKKKED